MQSFIKVYLSKDIKAYVIYLFFLSDLNKMKGECLKLPSKPIYTQGLILRFTPSTITTSIADKFASTDGTLISELRLVQLILIQ